MIAQENLKNLTQNLPDAKASQRFFAELEEKYPAETSKLLQSKNQGLLSDVLALAAWSPFLATTILQHKEYLSWLAKKRSETQTRSVEDLSEALARFALTNSALDAHVLLSRFRRRELLRIYLRDLRNLATIAEITEELSNLADAILQFALNRAQNELENRYGAPLATDERGRTRAAEFCVVALGKLGSRELNYASDIDLLFLYSNDGATSGTRLGGDNNAKVISNKEFFVKLGEQIAKIVGQAAGEGAAYRVDLRLRPHGRVGALAVSGAEAVNYYQKTARDWERQVMIRSRPAAGNLEVFKNFRGAIETTIYQPDISISAALASVKLSKQKINLESDAETGFNVKLGLGGIREIEFIAQALQLAHGGRDEWLRAAHTLISLARLADRGHLSDCELTELSAAYLFLRSLEHRLQMENGLQTHTVPAEENKRNLVAKRMNCRSLADFDQTLKSHTDNVNKVFERVFQNSPLSSVISPSPTGQSSHFEQNFQPENSENENRKTKDKGQRTNLKSFREISPYVEELLLVNPKLLDALLSPAANNLNQTNYAEILTKSVAEAVNFREELAVLRNVWSHFYFAIAAFDALGEIEMRESNHLQTALAEASLAAALVIVKKELARKYGASQITHDELRIAVLGLGRLGGRGMDYGSDLDLILIYDDAPRVPGENLTHAEFYSRAAEILVTALSSLTREGYLYRVDLRLRPDGKNGASASSKNAFLNYLETRSAIWEWLAYVKLRGVGRDNLAIATEADARQIVHQKAARCEVSVLSAETRRIRNLLEKQKGGNVRRGEIDIKHGAGGLLDVYFAVRFLQLRDSIFDEEENRTTSFTLQKLRAAGSLDAENFEILNQGYNFLRSLDHAARLVSGRSAKLPSPGNPLLEKIAVRLKYSSVTELLADLALNTANIRLAFEKLLA